MTKKLEFYRCNICGNIVQVIFEGEGNLVCCGHDMERLELKNSDADAILGEKHSPKLRSDDDCCTVYLDNHPMNQEHYIMLLQTVSEDGLEVKTKYLYPQDKIEMKSCTQAKISAYSYCNIHGLYKNKEE